MPPKVKLSREDIIDTAISIIRGSGASALNARTIAAALNCSTQPVFSNFATMEELRIAALEKANEICCDYLNREIESGAYPTYKASGMGYIRFAKEEKELFKFLYMRDRSKENDVKELKFGQEIETIVQDSTGLETSQMKVFHLEMWAYVHGIATMFATDFVDLDWELVSRMLTDAYLGMRKQYEME